MDLNNSDIWSKWILQRRFAGDQEQLQKALKYLYPIRDKVLRNAHITEQDILLDVGCGDGLIAFGALEKVPEVRVILNDISVDLLQHTQALAQSLNVATQCQFVAGSAEYLDEIPDASVTIVTTRSVLVYIKSKLQVLQEFYRVLQPNGRISLFEPINRFARPEPEYLFWGFDCTPIIPLVGKVKSVYRAIQPPESDPMIDFDERDLLQLTEQAGFSEIHLELEVEITPIKENQSWNTFIHIAPNPRVPTLEEAMQQVLTKEEQEQLTLHLRPLVETNQGTIRSAVAYLWATK